MSSENASEQQLHNNSQNVFGGQFNMGRRKSEQYRKYKKVHRNG
jgi:hypothetical protein